MQAYWDRIKAALEKIAPQLLEQLNPGISEKELIVFEEKTGVTLPEDFVAFYKIHNGQSSESAGLVNGEELLSLQQIYDQWKVWKEVLEDGGFEDEDGPYTSDPQNGIKNDWWNSMWLPVTHNGGGDHICIDLNPAEGGTKGQMIQMWHDDPERSIEAGSFKEWIENYVVLLESGQMVYDKDYFGIYNKEDLDL